MAHFHVFRSFRIGLLVLVACLIGSAAPTWAAGAGHTRQVMVPHEDRFTPFALTIHAGESVQWTNTDEDDHTVVSDDAFNTAGHKGTNQVLPADGGTFVLRFNRPGTFVYFCRFHSHLDGSNQPVAPGPDGGIQDAQGNFGTPMMGVITVLPHDD